MKAVFSRDNSLLFVGGRHYEFHTHPGQTDEATSQNCAMCDLNYLGYMSCAGFDPHCAGRHHLGSCYGFWKETQ